MARIDLLAAQGQGDAERFVRLGVPAERVTVTGSIKFDMRPPASLYEQAAVLRQQWEGRPVWVAASTHEGEEDDVLAAHQIIRQTLPDTLLVIVPRHPERFDRVAELCGQKGFSFVRRSTGEAADPDTSVYLGDTMGELTLILAAADAAFVGGSLIKRGGHNVLEPAALGKPTVFGPYMHNFAVISKLLLQQEAASQVSDREELARLMGGWLADASERTRIGENGLRVVEKNRGAMERLLALMEEKLQQLAV
jgi:3-deoxy-D-manno-octulosonic-acid transferase